MMSSVIIRPSMYMSFYKQHSHNHQEILLHDVKKINKNFYKKAVGHSPWTLGSLFSSINRLNTRLHCQHSNLSLCLITIFLKNRKCCAEYPHKKKQAGGDQEPAFMLCRFIKKIFDAQFFGFSPGVLFQNVAIYLPFYGNQADQGQQQR